ncbi:MAG: MFS transporter [Fibrobacterota bacterium]
MNDKKKILALRTLIMLLVFLMGIIGTGLIGPNRTSIEKEFSLSHGVFGAGIAAAQFFLAFSVLLLTPKIRKFSSLTVLTAALLLISTGLTGIFFSRSVAALSFFWSLVILGAAVTAIANNISMELWPDNPRKGVTLLHAFNSGGKVAGPVIVALSIAGGWRFSFMSVGLFAFSITAAFFIMRESEGPIKKAGPEKFDLSVLRSPFYWLSISMFALIAGGEMAFTTLFPAFLEETKGYSPGKASIFLTVHLVGLMTGRFISANLKEKITNNSIIGACLLTGLFFFPAVYIDHEAVRLVCLFFFGLIFSTTWPTYFAQASGFFSHEKEMFAYGSNLGNFMGFSIALLASSLVADIDLTASLYFGPAMLWLFGVIYYCSGLSKNSGLLG